MAVTEALQAWSPDLPDPTPATPKPADPADVEAVRSAAWSLGHDIGSGPAAGALGGSDVPFTPPPSVDDLNAAWSAYHPPQPQQPGDFMGAPNDQMPGFSAALPPPPPAPDTAPQVAELPPMGPQGPQGVPQPQDALSQFANTEAETFSPGAHGFPIGGLESDAQPAQPVDRDITRITPLDVPNILGDIINAPLQKGVEQLPAKVGPVPVEAPASAVTSFAAHSVPWALGGEIAGGLTTAAFTAQAASQGIQIGKAYQEGKLDGGEALKQLALAIGPAVLPFAIHGALKGAEWAKTAADTPEGQAYLASKSLAGERGEMQLPGNNPSEAQRAEGPASSAPEAPAVPEPLPQEQTSPQPKTFAEMDAEAQAAVADGRDIRHQNTPAEDAAAALFQIDKAAEGGAKSENPDGFRRMVELQAQHQGFDVTGKTPDQIIAEMRAVAEGRQQTPSQPPEAALPEPAAGVAPASPAAGITEPPTQPIIPATETGAGGTEPPVRPPTATGALEPPQGGELQAKLYDEYRRQYGAAAKEKMIEHGLITEPPMFAPVKPPVAPGGMARAGADAVGLGAPGEPEPMAAQLHVPVSEIPQGSMAQRLDAKPMPVDEAAMAVTDWLRKGEKLRPEQEDMFRAQRAAQAGKMEAAYQAGGDTAHISAKAAGAGAFVRPEMAPLDLSPEMNTLIRNEINTSGALQTFERTGAHDALDAMQNGRLPQPAQGAQLGKLLGPTFVEQLKKRGGVQYESAISQILNAPRALLTMGDLSATLRQSIVVAPRHPVLFGKAIVAQLQALKSQAVADALTQSITEHPDFPLLEGRVQLLGAKAGDLGGHEEAFQAPFLAKIPGIGQVYNASERAFSAMTNKVRWDYAYNTLDNWRAAGKEPTPQMLDNLGLYVNNLTGRGTLPRAMADHGALLNALFFAPKFTASRVQLIGDLLRPSQSAEVRMMAAQDLGAFVATGVGTLAAMKYFGGVSVGVDPRSSDFGKYTFMGQHHDFWAGFSPIARLIAREGTGKRVTATGNVASQDRVGAFTQFLRTKLAPIPGLAADVYTGSDLGGAAVDMAAFEHLDTQNPAYKLTAGLVIQDAISAYQQGGAKGVALALPGAVLGEGVTSYSTPAVVKLNAQNAAAKADGYSDFADASAKLGGPAANAKYASDPGVQSAQAELDKNPSPYRQALQATEPDQQANDAHLADGSRTPQQWRDANKLINQSRARGIADLNLADRPSGDSVMDGYFKVFTDNTNPKSGVVDDPNALQDALDAYTAQLSPEDQARLDANTGVGQTSPAKTEYRDAVKKIADAGYFGLRDRAFVDPAIRANFTSDGFKGIDQYKTINELRTAYIANVAPRLAKQNGISIESADATALRYFNSFQAVKDFDKRVAYAQLRIFQAHPDVLLAATKWGFNTLSKVEQRMLDASGVGAAP